MEQRPLDRKQAYGRIYDRRVIGLHQHIKNNEYKVMADPDNRRLVAKMNHYKHKAWKFYFLSFIEFCLCAGLVYFYIKK